MDRDPITSHIPGLTGNTCICRIDKVDADRPSGGPGCEQFRHQPVGERGNSPVRLPVPVLQGSQLLFQVKVFHSEWLFHHIAPSYDTSADMPEKGLPFPGRHTVQTELIDASGQIIPVTVQVTPGDVIRIQVNRDDAG